ncbi:hypothetical protein [Hyphomonas sp.]|uniref:hypothetical protein n=1 Tax=Hyphomonas sp. TaxID=87 RepID=UPI003918819C
MKRFVWLLLCGVLIAPPGLALKQDEAGRSAQALSDELTQIVERALNEGLLAPAEGQRPAPASPPISAPAVTADAGHDGHVPQVDCSAGYPLDFSAFRQMSNYQDILDYRQSVREMPAADRMLARAYLALDLSAEALINLRSVADHEADALRELARLMENRQLPDTDYFRRLSACHEGGRLWLGLALLIQGEREGAALIDQSVTAFRQLPPQLRDRYAMLAIPALDAVGERVLAQKLFSGFNPEEVANSSQLQLAKAVLDLGAGNPEGEAALRSFLGQGRFQETALFTLLRHGRTISQLERDVLLNGLLTSVEQARLEADIRSSLTFVLEELSLASRYETMIEMAARPNLQSSAAQAEIRRRFAEGLQRDLAGEDPLRALAAIEALVREEGLIEGGEARAALYEAGVLRAVRLGFGSLADALARKANPGQPVAEKRAILAYHRGEADTLKAKADEYPDNPSIARMAALAALRAGERDKVSELSARLTADPASVLALIEEDAATGRWIVPEPVYAAASALPGEEERRRVRRVMTLKRAAEGLAPSTEPDLTMAGMPETLLRSRLALESLPGKEP